MIERGRDAATSLDLCGVVPGLLLVRPHHVGAARKRRTGAARGPTHIAEALGGGFPWGAVRFLLFGIVRSGVPIARGGIGITNYRLVLSNI